MNPKRPLARLRAGSFSNVSFPDAQRLIEALGFRLERIGRSRHHIYKHSDIAERLNFQPRGGEAKEYQLRQLMELVAVHDLELEER